MNRVLEAYDVEIRELEERLERARAGRTVAIAIDRGHHAIAVDGREIVIPATEEGDRPDGDNDDEAPPAAADPPSSEPPAAAEPSTPRIPGPPDAPQPAPLEPGALITDPDDAEAVGLTADAARMRRAPRREHPGAVAARILDHITRHPGSTGPDLELALGLAQTTVSGQLTRLEKAGRIRRERDGRTKRNFPAGEPEPERGGPESGPLGDDHEPPPSPDDYRLPGGAIDLDAFDEPERTVVEYLIHAGSSPRTTAQIAVDTGLTRDAVGGLCVRLRDRHLIRGVRPASADQPPRWTIENR